MIDFCVLQEHKLCAHPIVEMYDGKNINFMAPLAKQDEFYVPECATASSKDAETSVDESTINDNSLSAGDQSTLESSCQEPSITPDSRFSLVVVAQRNTRE